MPQRAARPSATNALAAGVDGPWSRAFSLRGERLFDECLLTELLEPPDTAGHLGHHQTAAGVGDRPARVEHRVPLVGVLDSPPQLLAQVVQEVPARDRPEHRVRGWAADGDPRRTSHRVVGDQVGIPPGCPEAESRLSTVDVEVVRPRR